MFSEILSYGVPACITLYGFYILYKGVIDGFGSRTVRGPAARGLGLLMVSAFPLGVFAGPVLRNLHLDSTVPADADRKDALRTPEILRVRRDFDNWQRQHDPTRAAATRAATSDDLERLKAESETLKQYKAESDRRRGEMEGRIAAINAEVTQRHDQQAAEREKRAASRKYNGILVVGFAPLFVAWVLACMLGRKREPEVKPPAPL